MDLLSLMQFYITSNILIALAWLLLVPLRKQLDRGTSISFRHQLRFAYGCLVGAVVLPLLSGQSNHDFLPQAAQVWSGSSMNAEAFATRASAPVTIAFTDAKSALELSSVEAGFIAVLIAGLLLATARIVLGLLQLRATLRESQWVRRAGSLRILAADDVTVPFSFWLPTRHYIVVPTSLLSSRADLLLALRHEAQHHRGADTKWQYAFQCLSGVCFWNPFAHALLRDLRNLQELACDEAVIRRGRTDAVRYCECLVRIAEFAQQRRTSFIAMSMAGRSSPSVFIRRIEAMLNRPTRYLSTWKLASLTCICLGFMSVTAMSFAATIKDRRITFDDAQRMAANVSTSFPIVVNESVVQELNRYLGTPDGRAFVRDSIERMESHRALVSAKLTQYGLPKELMAVPLVESGYQNLPPNQQAGRGAGLWMFIAPTAVRYSLRVDAQVDERLDVAAETDAAMRMFSNLQSQFGDWGLALLAYNSGNALVERGIRETGSRDVWKLVGSGYENEADYIPRVMAAILILENPAVLD